MMRCTFGNVTKILRAGRVRLRGLPILESVSRPLFWPVPSLKTESCFPGFQAYGPSLPEVHP